MKKILKYLFITVLCAGLTVSCKEEETLGTEKPFFGLDESMQALTYRAVGGVKYVDVKTNMKFEVSSTEDWCLPEINGKGKDNLRITVEETDIEEERVAMITIKVEDGKSYSISITQSGMPVPPPPFAAGDARVAAANPALYYSFENADDYTLPAIGDAHIEFTDESSVTAVSGPGSGKMALHLPAGTSIKVPKPATGDLDTYTVMFDVKVTAWVNNKFIGLLQPNPDNTTDGILFIKPSGQIGASQYTPDGTVAANTWYRIVMVVGGESTFKLYLNGNLILNNTSSSTKGRVPLKGEYFWLFNDEDGEIGDVDFAGFAIWPNKLLSEDEVAELGDINDINIPLSVDSKVTNLNPNLYYAFLDADDYTKPVAGETPLVFTNPVSAASNPPSGKAAVNIPAGNFVKVQKPVSTELNVYTVMFDVKVNSWTDNKFIGLLQPNPDNSSDGVLFIKPSGQIGASQYTADGTFVGNTWYRILMVVDGVSTFKLYLNGALVLDNTSNGTKGRIPMKGEHFWIFTDEDGEVGDVDCAGFAMWANRALTADEVADLGSL